ncbi:MAG TPA: hydroxymethylglutaryl-CoA lyase [Acidimicrobiales bacterium]|nr:hydroxymethylglutaryl-CoA lyase [Acidimicrobiales bacterium]
MVVLRDVTLRDGLQDEAPVSTQAKLELFEALVAAGIRDLELTSFVRPDRVPAMADAEEMVAATAGSPVTRWGLVLNERGAQRALAAGLRHLQWVISVSEAHQRENAGQSVAEGLAGLARVVALADADGAVVELTLATAFGCPFTGPVPLDDVVRVAEAAVAAGVKALGLADTIGTAVPTEIGPAVTRVAALGLPVGIHLHDTRGLAITNALRAIEAGVERVDGSVGGLGGCPFAPGASGNLALEDLAHALDAMGVETGVDVAGMVEAARVACRITGRSVQSHVGVAGPRFAGTPYATS